jgi:hypothetical protein
MPMYIEAFAVGSTVTIGDDINGLVTGILLDGDGLQYKVAWWSGRERKCEWLTNDEVHPVNPIAVRIGFRNGEGP